MDNTAIINILVSFVIIGILVLLYSVENTLWALYWILFTLYLMVFFSIGLKLHESNADLLTITMPILLISFLITWLIQIFSSKYELIQEDKLLRKTGLAEKVPNTFYDMYTGVLLLMIVKISLYVGLIRNKLDKKVNPGKGMQGKNENQTRLIYLSVYGMSIISFLLLVGMSLVSDYYITDG